MRSETPIVEPEVADPPVDDASVLPGRNVRASVRSTAEQVARVIRCSYSQKLLDRLPRHLSDLELDWATGLELGNDPTVADERARADLSTAGRLLLEVSATANCQVAVATLGDGHTVVVRRTLVRGAGCCRTAWAKRGTDFSRVLLMRRGRPNAMGQRSATINPSLLFMSRWPRTSRPTSSAVVSTTLPL